MNLIVNADDFGMSHTKNLAIDEMMKKNICTNASLVVNMPSTYEAVELAVKNGYDDRITLHLNLTVGESLTKDIRKIELYYHNNQFAYRPVITMDKQIYPNFIEVITSELDAQIKKFLKLGIQIKSIDSHNWIHLRLPVWYALQPIIEKYNIQIIRPMWSRYKCSEIATEKWSEYFRKIEPILLKCPQYNVIEHSSNIEQFLVDEAVLSGLKNIEVFTHPDIVQGKIMDLSSSYLGRSKAQVIDNVALIRKYQKVSVNYILEEVRK